jgi:hypothetical protein
MRMGFVALLAVACAKSSQPPTPTNPDPSPNTIGIDASAVDVALDIGPLGEIDERRAPAPALLDLRPTARR